VQTKDGFPGLGKPECRESAQEHCAPDAGAESAKRETAGHLHHNERTEGARAKVGNIEPTAHGTAQPFRNEFSSPSLDSARVHHDCQDRRD
jgi:hypothetical protein